MAKLVYIMGRVINKSINKITPLELNFFIDGFLQFWYHMQDLNYFFFQFQCLLGLRPKTQYINLQYKYFNLHTSIHSQSPIKYIYNDHKDMKNNKNIRFFLNKYHIIYHGNLLKSFK